MQDEDENRYEKNGVIYLAKPGVSISCRGCAFINDTWCDYPGLPPCIAHLRADGTNIVWVAEDAP
jgi:hypothetical protein